MTTRPMSDVESSETFRRLGMQKDALVAQTVKYFAGLYLAYYRQLLAKHNLSNHRITVTAAMGQCGINVDGQPFEFIGLSRRDTPVVHLLNQILESFDWEWAQYLDGESLAGYK